MYLLSCLRVGTDNGFCELFILFEGWHGQKITLLSQVRISSDNRLPVSGEGWH